ncbi:NUDIX domain-containing protein [Hyphomicrobium sp. CS1BSMeth3]|uniref:NUDIX domain-containing protein n=1 Tax=Hyphomicrobium sp. CS1BSMeth3 TaxID=1892844 RepID=UPI001FCD190E|nr:NUDIX domain-containing protein [Hyphomicrobium sp. CS1BSMeth3]
MNVFSHATGALRLHVRRASSFATLKADLKAGAQRAAPMVFDKVARRLAQRYWRWRRALTLGVRGIVIDDDGRILLVRHTYVEGWALPGGGVEFGETLEEALARELDEEGGVTIDGTPELVGIYDNRALFPGDHVAIYVIRQWHRNRVPKPNLEIAETGFFHPDHLPENVAPAARRRIEEMLGRRSPQAAW